MNPQICQGPLIAEKKFSDLLFREKQGMRTKIVHHDRLKRQHAD